MMKLIYFLFFITLSSSALAQTMPAGADPRVWAEALKIHRRAIIVDGHNDIPGPLVDEDFDLAANSVGRFQKYGGTPFHTDLARMKASGVTGEFLSIYVGGDTWQAGRAMERAMDMIDASYREVEKHPAHVMMCTTSAEIRRAKKENKTCLLMGIEGGYAIENSLHALRNFYRLGVRYMTLTHNVSHDWADAHAGEVKNNGLSEFGKEVVREMNRIGMLIDISHVSDKVMHDVLDVSKAPIIASHSSARGVRNHTRNVPDDVLKRVTQNGGVIMVNFYPAFLDERTATEDAERSTRLRPQLEELRKQFANDPQGYNEAERKLFAANPIYVTPYSRIVDHIDHIKKVAGIDYVGLGSDYDGVPYLPAGMNGMEDLALVTFEMHRRGYTEEEIRKVLGENFMRAMAQAERIAGNRQISGQGSLKKIKKP
jgi:membrane dipeptidase